MPRLVKPLPENRADCTFGDLVYWHFFRHGTRPDTDPSAKIGRVWGLKRASEALGISERALRYWINDKHLPDSTSGLERVIFGSSPVFDDWRLELVEALHKTRLANAARSAGPRAGSGMHAVTGGQLVRLDTGAVVTGDEDPEDEQSEFEIVPSTHIFRDEPVRNSRGEIIVPAPEIFHASRKAQPPRAARPQGQRRHAAIVVVGIATLLGLYAWANSGKRDAAVVREASTTKEIEIPVRPPPEKAQPQQGPTRSASADTPETKEPAPTPAEKARREAEARSEAQRQAQLAATRDAVEAKKREQESSARAMNEKLKILAQADGDLCKQKLEGLSVPGFTLKCDTLIPFGKMLGAVPVSQTASSLGDCAARCRKVKDCVAFSFDAGAHVGASSCYLTGSIPAYNPAPNWIAGTR
jgi:hypothetical protein